MIYECKHCGYTTNRQLNIVRHENRKNPCKKTTNGGGVHDEVNVGNIETNVGNIETNVGKNEINVDISTTLVVDKKITNTTCNKCNVKFCNKTKLNNHMKICKGVDSLTCHICLTKFENRMQKYKHKKNVDCKPPPPPTIPLSQLVNQHPFDTDTTEYIYLLQTRESLRNKETIYKVGRTCKEGLQRFKFYPKGSKLLLHIFCFDSVTVEKNILSQFNDKFKNASTYGKEYFDGELTEMVSIVLKEVSSTFNCCFSMTRI